MWDLASVVETALVMHVRKVDKKDNLWAYDEASVKDVRKVVTTVSAKAYFLVGLKVATMTVWMEFEKADF